MNALTPAEKQRAYRRRQAVKEIAREYFEGKEWLTVSEFLEVATEFFGENFNHALEGLEEETDEYKAEKDQVWQDAYDEAYQEAYGEAYEKAHQEAYDRAYNEAYQEAYDKAIEDAEDYDPDNDDDEFAVEFAKEEATLEVEEASRDAIEEEATLAVEEIEPVEIDEPAREAADEAVEEWESNVDDYWQTRVVYQLSDLVEAYRAATPI